MEKNCDTCKHGPCPGCAHRIGVCFMLSKWEPKEFDIRAAQEKPPCHRCGHSEDGSPADVQVCPPCLQSTGYKNFLAASDPFGPCSETPLSDTQKRIAEICDEIKNILLEKNRKYGDSALNPKRVFSKASPIEQINVRIDDKISRIMSAQDDDTEDAELDLIGYLILKRVAKSVVGGK